MYECLRPFARALISFILLNFADKAVVDVNILLTHTVHGRSFVNNVLFNQRIQKLRCQFGGGGILFET